MTAAFQVALGDGGPASVSTAAATGSALSSSHTVRSIVGAGLTWHDSSGGPPSEEAFVGRPWELDAAARRTQRAAAGLCQVVWIEGVAGSGKSALLRRILDDLRESFAVTWAEGDESSIDASFSFVSQYGPIDASTPFAAGLQMIERLGGASSRSSVAVVAEDLHWADGASREALLTAARRLRHDRVLLLVTARPDPRLDGWNRFLLDSERCLRVRLGPLDDGEVGELAARHGVLLTPTQATRLRRHTDGHPLHIRTLLQELTPAQLRSTTSELPAPRTLAALTVASLTPLPAASRELASALAVLVTRTPLAVAAGVAGIERGSEALEPLLGTGLVRWWPAEDRTPVAFSHPLYRTAVYEDLAPMRRRELHLRSAAVTRWGASWAHRVAASDASDDGLADELDAGARYEVERRELSVAATYLTWASSLTSARERAEERLQSAVRLLIIDGQTTRAAALYPHLEDSAETALRDLVLGRLAFAQADAPGAERWLNSATRLSGRHWVHADAQGQLGMLYTLQGRSAAVVTAAEAALSLRPLVDPEIDHSAWWALGLGVAMEAGAPAGLVRLAERLPMAAAAVAVADAELLAVRGILRNLAGRTHAAIDDLRTAIDRARTGSPFRQLPRAHVALSRALFDAGAWDEAQVHGRTALSLMDEHRVWMRSQAESALVPVLAARGELELARQYDAEAAAAAAELTTIETDIAARVARAAVSRADGDPQGVIAALGPLVRDEPLPGLTRLTMLQWWPILIAATLAAGRLDEAENQITRFATACADAALEASAYVAGSRGRLAAARNDPDEAIRWFDRALGSMDADYPMLERALLHHAYGRVLRGRGVRRGARDQLRMAHEILERLGAHSYLRAVVEDLSEWGGSESGPMKRSPLALTTREQDVVALVSKGLTNKEVGAQLYISAKAVEYHLGNVYGKLGVRSRRELRAVMS